MFDHEWQVAIVEDEGTFLPHEYASLWIYRRVSDDKWQFVVAGNTIITVDEGATHPDASIKIPLAAVEKLAVAVQNFQGHTSHADTEARVLREWLTVERQRVDALLTPEVQHERK